MHMVPVRFSLQRSHQRALLVALITLVSCSVLISNNRAGTAAATNDADRVILLADNTIRCPLREGETTFIVASEHNSILNWLTFINENATARGELSLFVSNDKLSSLSDKWRVVEGRIRFDHKRLFNVSLFGIEARYVKLVFQVEHELGESRILAGNPVARLSIIPRL